MPGPQDDLESMIWVLCYVIMLHHQESLRVRCCTYRSSLIACPLIAIESLYIEDEMALRRQICEVWTLDKVTEPNRNK
jgi:hypothetical protein